MACWKCRRNHGVTSEDLYQAELGPNMVICYTDADNDSPLPSRLTAKLAQNFSVLMVWNDSVREIIPFLETQQILSRCSCHHLIVAAANMPLPILLLCA